MTTAQQHMILATVPVLREANVLLTTHFYKRMFQHNEELKHVFNMGNQQSGKQQTALAMTLLAYAENIENPAVLLPAINNIAHKHTSLQIQPAQYAIVGHHLLASIAEVLGQAATPAILDAWAAAYHQLATWMQGHEAAMYEQQAATPHSWTGWRTFTVRKKIAVSAEITSFYLYPADGGKVPRHQPGQFISLRLFLPEIALFQIRQYSISSAPNNDYYRISVKRETASQPDRNGMISNYLHDAVSENDNVEIAAPAGTFILQDTTRPAMFISGGVGLTPFMSMLETLLQQEEIPQVIWMHGCREAAVHAFKAELIQWEKEHESLTQKVFYNKVTAADIREGIHEGYPDIHQMNIAQHPAHMHYYLCGPGVFITKQYQDLLAAGISRDHIFYEEFGPQVLSLSTS
ncbi:NO-inducible flavohemoprotein [Chitinophaga nivalis]|uniref:nitric oxide dioxygenase n=1 Tax=Chitinophaga nivalis TaxID=2991709 RepID=A0ABT3IL13_9BACT|nr:NO-inducible flavohemoprotein [Chitinophaga nivalis]MCW3465860.1 NO-inducible flavohemoprotein [Chitinophaga nivalis]MCW3484449.1 NO-inducible flavohemoprotein [Chitinophaga nivalis]